MPVTGLFLVDGGRLFDEQVIQAPNRLTFYRTTMLPSFGMVLQGLESRLNATGYNYFANMSRNVGTGLIPIFADRPATFVPRGNLNQVSGDRTPVIVAAWASGDFLLNADYRFQFRAVNAVSGSRVEFFPIFDIKVIPEV